MKAFLAHVGHPGNIDIDFTVTRRRNVSELVEKLPTNAPERSFFDGTELRTPFPGGWFNCWGVPRGAFEEFKRLVVGDLVLIAPTIGIHNGGIHQLGVVKAISPIESFSASQILWPETPRDKLFPWIFLFDSEKGFRPWFDFLNDVSYRSAYNPRGLFKSIAEDKFTRWGGVNGYLDFLRTSCGFRTIFPDQDSTQAPTIPFGDSEHNRRVEVAAVAAVTKWYQDRGWNVHSVEREKCGFDLLCRLGSQEEKAEVKGTSSSARQCIITARELAQAKSDANAMVWIVTNALSAELELHRYSGDQFIQSFALQPLQYLATLA